MHASDWTKAISYVNRQYALNSTPSNTTVEELNRRANDVFIYLSQYTISNREAVFENTWAQILAWHALTERSPNDVLLGVLRHFSSAIGNVPIYWLSTPNTEHLSTETIPDQMYLRGSATCGIYEKKLPQFSISGEAHLTSGSFSRLKVGSIILSKSTNNESVSLNSPKFLATRINYQGNDHPFSAAILIRRDISLKGLNLDGAAESFKNAVNLVHRTLQPDHILRSTIRHSVLPAILSIESASDYLKDNIPFDLPKDGKMMSTVFQVQRQAQKMTKRVRAIAKTRWDESWNSEFIGSDLDRLSLIGTSEIRSEAPHSLRERMRDARKLTKLGIRSEIRIISEPESLEVLIRCSKQLILEAYEELIINASKYREPNTPIIMYFHVENNGGIGTYVLNQTKKIPSAEMRRLTRPGFRGRAFVETKPGTGLGLAKVESICEALKLGFRVTTRPSTDAPIRAAARLNLTKSPHLDLFFARIAYSKDQIELTRNI